MKQKKKRNSTYQQLALALETQDHDHLQQVQKHKDFQDVHD